MTLDEIQKMSDYDVVVAISGLIKGSFAYPLTLDACHGAEEQFAMRAGFGAYRRLAKALERVVFGPRGFERHRCYDELYRYAHATARQRADAILLAVQEGETPDA